MTGPLLGAALAAATLLATAPDDREVGPERAAQWASFFATPAQGGVPTLDEVVGMLNDRLAPTGTELFDLFGNGTLPPTGEEGVEQPLSGPQLDVVLAALCARPDDEVRGLLEERVQADSPARTRGAALRVMGHVGRGADLARMTALASPPTPQEPVDPGLRRELGRSVLAVLRRDETGFKHLSAVLGGVHPALHAELYRAVGESGARAGLGLLVERLRADREVDALLLAQVGLIADGLEGPFDDRVLFPVRSFFRLGCAPLQRQAVLAAGKLQDFEAIPELLDLLDEDDPGLRGNVYWALRRITGHELRDDPVRWRMWYADEERWWKERSRPVLARLHSPDSKGACEAIGELAMRKINRHLVARELIGVLDHRSPEVVRAACSALEQLGSRAAVERLTGCLTHPDEGVRAAAHAALCSLTGKNLPADSDDWLEGGR